MTFSLTANEQSAFDTLGIPATTFLNSRVEEIVNQAKARAITSRATDIDLLSTADKTLFDTKIAAAKEAREPKK